MDDKEFRKLRREDLIEIIYQYQRRDQKLTQENEMLRRQLEDRTIRLQKTGSIAEAAMALSGVFEAAQKAADLYLQSVQAYDPSLFQNSEKVPAEKTSAALPAKGPDQKPVQQKPKTEKMAQKSVQQMPKTEEMAQKSVQQRPKTEVTTQMKQEKNPEVPVQKTEPQKEAKEPQKPQVSSKAQEGKKLSEKPEEKTPAAQKTETDLKKQPAEADKPAKTETVGKDTDEFIASLKEYLGM